MAVTTLPYAKPEAEARDRETTLIGYLGALLRSAADDLDFAAEGLPGDGQHGRAAQEAITALAMAAEHLDELRRLSGRRIAGTPARS